MTVEEKRKEMQHKCDSTCTCADEPCPLWLDKSVHECEFDDDDFVNKYFPILCGAEADAVDHPSHYNQGGIECIDAMVAAFGKEAVSNFCLINAFKYVWRSKLKNGTEDIDKAIWYLSYVKELSNE